MTYDGLAHQTLLAYPEIRDRVMDEELGGPFVMTPAKREFAEGTDPSNPEDSEREPFPIATGQGELPFESEPEL